MAKVKLEKGHCPIVGNQRISDLEVNINIDKGLMKEVFDNYFEKFVFKLKVTCVDKAQKIEVNIKKFNDHSSGDIDISTDKADVKIDGEDYIVPVTITFGKKSGYSFCTIGEITDQRF